MRNVTVGIMILLIAVILLGCNGTSPVVATPDMTPTATPSPSPSPTPSLAPYMEPTQPLPMDEGIKISFWCSFEPMLHIKYPGGDHYEVITDHGHYTGRLILLDSDVNSWIKSLKIRVYDENDELIHTCQFNNVMFACDRGYRVFDEDEHVEQVEMLWVDDSDELLAIERNIAAFRNLIYLDIDGLECESLDTLKTLQKLRVLHVSLRSEEDLDLAPLSNMRCLRSLSLACWQSKVYNLEALASLTQLEKLSKSGFRASNLNVLSNFINLTEIYLRNGELEQHVIYTLPRHLKKATLLNLTSEANLESVVELEELSTDTIVDLSSLINLPKLVRLELDNVYDLEPITQIDSLKYLTLFYDEKKNSEEVLRIPTLAQLKDLVITIYSGPEQLDIGGLKGMQSLESLSFIGAIETWVEIVNVNALAHLDNLVSLYVDHEGVWVISDISFLETMEKLKHLTIDLWGIKNVTPLVKLTSLESLSVSASELPRLSGLDNLKDMELRYCSELDLKCIKNTHLKKLRFWECYDLKSLEAIDTIENLEELYILVDNNKAIPDFKNLKNLVSLSLYDNEITHLSLIHLNQLREMCVAVNPIVNILFLTNCPKLRKLFLNDTCVNDVSILSELKDLEYIDISYTDVTSISPLATLENLKYLNVEGCSIEDFEAFSDREDIVIVR